MTTIVWAKGKLGCDGRSTTAGGTIMGTSYNKVILRPEGKSWKIMGVNVLAYAVAGDTAADVFLEEALSSEEGLTHRSDLKCPFKMSFSAIVVDENHQGWKVRGSFKSAPNVPDSLHVHKTESPSCVGSGGAYAMVALRAGLSVKKAIKAAIENDSGSGGKVQVFKLPKLQKDHFSL